MEEPLIKPKVPRRKKSAKAINTRNKKLWGTLKRTVSTAVAIDENVFVHSHTANTYVDVPPSFSDADYEMSNGPTLLNGECDGNTYFQAAFFRAHSSSGQHLNYSFNQESRRVYNVIHSSWYKFGIYCLLSITHCILGLYTSKSLTSCRTLQLVFEWLVLFMYIFDIWCIRKICLRDETLQPKPKIRHVTLQKDYDGSNADDHQHSCFDGLFHSQWNNLRIIFVVSFLIDLIVFSFSNNQLHQPRVTTFLRPLMLIFRIRTFRRMMRAVAWSATRIAKVFIIILFQVVFCGFVAFVLFSSLPNHPFSILSTSMVDMLLILTAPGTVLGHMESVYTATSGFGVIFFVVYVILTNILLKKIVLATAYRSFKMFMKKELLQAKHYRNHARATAFDMVTQDGEKKNNKKICYLLLFIK